MSEGVALGDTQKGNQNKGNVSLAEALVVELKVEVGLVKLKKNDVRIDRCQRKIILPGVLLHNQIFQRAHLSSAEMVTCKPIHRYLKKNTQLINYSLHPKKIYPVPWSC